MIDQRITTLEGGGEQVHEGQVWSETPSVEVPERLAIEEGHEVIQEGDIKHARDVWESQGHNEGLNGHPFEGTCGLASIAQLLKLFGFGTSERQVVDLAIKLHKCVCDSPNPQTDGGTTQGDRLDILGCFGYEARAEPVESMEQIAKAFEACGGALVSLNAGVLWNDRNASDTGGANHCVTVVGVARDPSSNEVVGFYINDTGPNLGGGQFVSVEKMKSAVVGPSEHPVYGEIIAPLYRREPVIA